MWPLRVKMPTQNLLRFLLWPMLMLRNVLTIVWCRFGGWSLVIKSIFCPDFEHKVWPRYWSWSSGEILKLKFTQYFAADLWLRLWRLFLVEILKLRLLKIFKLKFSRNADIWLNLLPSRDYENEIWSRFFSELVIWPKEVSLVTRTQLSGPLCLWQCFS